MTKSELLKHKIILNGKKCEGISILVKRDGTDKIMFPIVFVIFLIHSCALIFPALYMIISSLKTADQYFVGNPFSLPEEWLFSNYTKALLSLNVGKISFPTMLFNSLWYVTLGSLGGIIAPMLVGYVLAVYRFGGRNIIYSVIIFAITTPVVGLGGSSLKIIGELGLYDNPMLMVVNLFGGCSGSFLIFYGFFKSVSWSYAEAVQIDGGGPYTIFFKIMLPMTLPICLTYFITNSIAFWNQYESVLLMYPSWLTVSAGLFQYKSNYARNDYPLYFSGLVISMVPSIALFAIFSKKIMGTITIGGIKG